MRKIFVFAAIIAALVAIVMAMWPRKAAEDAAAPPAEMVKAESLLERADSLVAIAHLQPDSCLGDAYVEALECVDSARRMWPGIVADTAAVAELRDRVEVVERLLDLQLDMLKGLPSATAPIEARRQRVKRVLARTAR